MTSDSERITFKKYKAMYKWEQEYKENFEQLKNYVFEKLQYPNLKEWITEVMEIEKEDWEQFNENQKKEVITYSLFSWVEELIVAHRIINMIAEEGDCYWWRK